MEEYKSTIEDYLRSEGWPSDGVFSFINFLDEKERRNPGSIATFLGVTSTRVGRVNELARLADKYRSDRGAANFQFESQILNQIVPGIRPPVAVPESPNYVPPPQTKAKPKPRKKKGKPTREEMLAEEERLAETRRLLALNKNLPVARRTEPLPILNPNPIREPPLTFGQMMRRDVANEAARKARRLENPAVRVTLQFDEDEEENIRTQAERDIRRAAKSVGRRVARSLARGDIRNRNVPRAIPMQVNNGNEDTVALGNVTGGATAMLAAPPEDLDFIFNATNQENAIDAYQDPFNQAVQPMNNTQEVDMFDRLDYLFDEENAQYENNFFADLGVGNLQNEDNADIGDNGVELVPMAVANTPYGRVTFQIHPNFAPAGGVPVVNVDADVDTDVQYDNMGGNGNLPFIEVVGYTFQDAYNQAVESVGANRMPGDFVQIRLMAGPENDMTYDLASQMVPVQNAIGDFQRMIDMYEQSDRDLSTLTFYRLRFTFVLSNGRRDVVNAANVGDIINIAGRANRNPNDRLPRPVTAQNARLRYLANALVPDANNDSRIMSTLRRRKVNALVRRQRDIAPAEVNTVGPYRARPRLGVAINNPVGAIPFPPAPNANARPRRVLTDLQRQRYNENKRAKRANNSGREETRGVYEDIKRRLFHHSSIEQFFRSSKAIDKVPNTWEEGHCLMMALLHSELRVYVTSNPELEIWESTPIEYAFNTPEAYLYPIQPAYHALCGKISPFVDGYHIVMFNPYKKVSKNREAKFKYDYEVTAEEKQIWFQAACSMHSLVCETVGRELDPNSNEVLQHYADAFGVYICVYRLECRGRRTNVYRPFNDPVDTRSVETIKVVNILITDGHASSITSLRDFMKSTITANRTTMFNYCLFCERMPTANNETVEESKSHFYSCCAKHNGKITCAGETALQRKAISETCPSPFATRKKDRSIFCRLCNQEVVGGVDGQMEHVCFINKPSEFKVGKNSEIFVYDMECAQVFNAANNLFIHKVNLVCVRGVYPDESGNYESALFHDIQSFMDYVMQHSTENRVYIAHNGSKYDVQFVMRYLEKNLISHSFVPTPSSMHAYLSVTIPFGNNLASTFIDFRHFMPGSLKNIGISFGLSVAKGDFPHKFNNGLHEDYIGRLPELDHPDDYWCLSSKKTEEDISEFREWYFEQSVIYCTCHESCVCDRKKWDFQEEIIRYCWLDVDVLAEACMKYRNNALEFGVSEEYNEGWVSKGIDPFQYLTIPQLALNLLLGGAPEEERVSITLPKTRTGRVPLAIAWMERYYSETGDKVAHIANSHREYFCSKTKRYLDGYSQAKKVFVCLQCEFHGCQSCYYNEMEMGTNHPTRAGTYSMVNADTKKFVTDLFKYYGTDRVLVIWEHDLSNYSPREKMLGDIMKDRDMFYGGRTEVFSPYANTALIADEEIKYHDVCSLYPYVCAFKRLPTGHPEHLFGAFIDKERITNLRHPNPYFGYIRCTVIPNRQDTLGLLPFRDPTSGRLEFPLFPMTGCWGTEELRLALENGYVIEDIFEVYHWSEAESSDTLLRGYVSFFLRMKQESEGWKKLGASSETPDLEEQLLVQQKVFIESGCIGRIRIENVAKNPVKRQMAKLFLNSLWGKFCQKPHSEHYTVIHGYQQFASLWFDPTVDRSKFCFRHLGGDTWKVKYAVFDDYTRPNPKYNIFLSSKVTEWARCILHRRMLVIGPERVLYCDTDSIMFLWPKNGVKLDNVGLGNWVDEYPNKTILRLYALAPKFYYLEFEDDSLLKSKGIQVNAHNTSLIHGESLAKQLLELFFPRKEEGELVPFTGYIPMQNMLIGINATNANISYGEMTTRNTQDKRLGPVFSKRTFVYYTKKDNVTYSIDIRHLLARIYTLPKNYFKTLADVSVDKYEYLDV